MAVVLTLVRRDPRPLWRRAQVYVGGLLLASVLSLVFVWAFYALHVLEMPVAEQDKLIHGSTSHPHGLTILNKVPLMKPLVQYLFGLARVFGRVAGGGPTYFNGTAKIGSFRWYFPELLLVKTQIAFLLLTLVVAVVASRRLIAKGLHWSDITAHVEQNLLAWVVGGYGLFYLSTAMAGNLNLGIRHILPIYVPFFVVVGTSVVSLYRELKESSWRTPALLALSALLAWYGLSTAFVHPAYTAYFNEFIGGPAYANGYFSDSSVDWGQDLRRLKAYLREHPEVRSVAIDYFGGGDLKYYFCSAERVNAGVPKGAVDLCRARVYEEWTPELGRYRGQYLRPEHDGPLQGYVPPEQARGSDGYVAVSETLLQNDSAAAQRRYGYLLNRTPTAKIGYSIYLYKLN